ncbi:calcium-binding protein [Microcoleus sp. D2_18a_B4]|uniref:calcium-binding protein n=1 Tax=Microcoleus sp. D2_18a_B4 TaxID=3055329 RepID=UPI002FCF0420
MTTTPVSVDSAGNLGNSGSYNPSISADGRFVAFSSLASNIVPGDTNNTYDIFVRDRLTNTTTRVSVDSAGNQADRNSDGASISPDGRFVAFNSDASNLVPGDTNNTFDIFVRDRLTNTTTRVSVDSAGNQGNSRSTSPSISADGRFVAFDSGASNIVPGDTNNSFDIFVRDRLTNTTTLVSVDSAGNQGNSGSGTPSISADGRFVAFSSVASNLVPGDTNDDTDIFVRDRLTNTTTRLSVDSAGNQGNGNSYNPSISADGRFVAFSSVASNIVPGDTNNRFDIFVRDRLTNTTTGLSVDSAGNPGNLQSGSPSISADGRFVAFTSEVSNLVPGDTNINRDIFVRDTLTNTTTRVSVDSAGNQADRNSDGASISADGRFVAFSSFASNIVPGDTNNTDDIFVVDTSSTPKVINGTDGNDNLTGTSGNDIINSSEGDDVLTGLRASDVLNGGDGNDILYGGKASDTLNGGLGNDNLVGGAGNDVFVLGAGLGVDTISDFTNSQDTIQLINGLTFGQLSISSGTNGTLIRVASSGEVLAALTGVAPNFIGSEDFISV